MTAMKRRMKARKTRKTRDVTSDANELKESLAERNRLLVQATQIWAKPGSRVRRPGAITAATVLRVENDIAPGAVLLDNPLENYDWWNVGDLEPAPALPARPAPVALDPSIAATKEAIRAALAALQEAQAELGRRISTVRRVILSLPL